MEGSICDPNARHSCPDEPFRSFYHLPWVIEVNPGGPWALAYLDSGGSTDVPLRSHVNVRSLFPFVVGNGQVLEKGGPVALWDRI